MTLGRMVRARFVPETTLATSIVVGGRRPAALRDGMKRHRHLPAATGDDVDLPRWLMSGRNRSSRLGTSPACCLAVTLASWRRHHLEVTSMSSPSRVIENPLSGERITIIKRPRVAGDALVWELALAPGGRVPNTPRLHRDRARRLPLPVPGSRPRPEGHGRHLHRPVRPGDPASGRPRPGASGCPARRPRQPRRHQRLPACGPAGGEKGRRAEVCPRRLVVPVRGICRYETRGRD